MLFFGKENVFMCLVVFQKIFRKIFSSVWKMLQGKRQNQKNKHSTQIDAHNRRGLTTRCFASSSPTTAPSITISRSIAPLREIAIDGAISRSVDRNLAKHRADCDRREGEFAISDRNRRRWCLRTTPTGAWTC